MTVEEFRTIVKGLKAVYTDPKFIPDEDAMNMWYQLLKDFPYDLVSSATQAYMMSEIAPPYPASICRKVAEITTPDEERISESEAWSMVEIAARNGLRGSQKEYDRLPPLVQKAVGSASRIYELAIGTSKDLSFEKGIFLKNYRALIDKSLKDRELSTPLRKSIELTRQAPIPQIDMISDNDDDYAYSIQE